MSKLTFKTVEDLPQVETTFKELKVGETFKSNRTGVYYLRLDTGNNAVKMSGQDVGRTVDFDRSIDINPVTLVVQEANDV